MENKLIVIDGNSLINRAYYAMNKNPMVTKYGIYTEAVYGFINMLEKLKKEYDPQYLVVTFDVKAPTFRHKEYDKYKSDRKGMPLELVMQLPILKEVLDAMNIMYIEMEGFEADDLIGTISRQAEEKQINTLIVTGDRDALQLATDKTEVLFTKKGVSKFDLYNEKTFIDEYGFTPTQFIDCKGLMGDKSDNIPGVKGIGVKTATKLIVDYGSIENIYEKIDEVGPKGVQNKLMENYTQAFMSKRLATINRFVPMDMDFDQCQVKPYDYDKLVEIYTKLEFNSFLKKLEIPKDCNKNDELNKYAYKVIDENTIDDFKEAISKVQEVGIKVTSDQNHKDIPVIENLAIAVDNTVYIFEWAMEEYRKYAEEAISTKAIYGHDIKNDIYNLLYLGMADFRVSGDVAIAEYVLDASKNDYAIEGLAWDRAQINMDELAETSGDEEMQLDMFAQTEAKKDYSNLANWFTIVDKIREIQLELLKEEELLKVYEEVELPLIEVMAYMEYVGFTVDVEKLHHMGVDLTNQIDEIAKNIHDLAGEDFNINSPKQLGVILFEKLQLPFVKKTKSGYATGAEVLEKIADKHEIVPLILEYRKLAKLNSTYVEGLNGVVAKDGKIHANFNQTVTTTGRISSSNPNMQNIPVKEEIGKQIRSAFVPMDDDYILMGADYSQIELRVLAHMSGDEALIDAFNKGLDIHKATASRVMGVPEDEVTPLQRSSAKAINFGVIYGMSSYGLSTGLNISVKEAEKYINDYFEKHKAVKDFMDLQVGFCREHGYVKTLLGRKRYIRQIKASNFNIRQANERLAMNTPIQGSAADIIKLAMIKVYNGLKGMKSRLLLQVHDELILEVHKDEEAKVKEILRENMENAIKLSVELSVDLNEGKNWMELK